VDLAALQHEEIGFDSERRIVIPNGIDVRKFKPMGSGRELLRDELGVSEDALVVGAVGRYHPQKDFGCFLRAAASVVWGGVDVHFVLAGRGVDSSNHELMSLASELGIVERLHLLGERQDISSVMSGLDLFVSSSDNEGFSNVLGEAMACGIPCVATDVGAAAEVLSGIGGLVPVGEPLVLGATISQMLALPAERRAVIGLRCRMRIERSYSAAGMAERYADLYHTLAEAPPAARFEELCSMAA
jgi:glycosyltransferase involved in cell wall biosynthesis